MSKDNVIDFEGARPTDQFEVAFAASGQFEKAADGAIATLRTRSDPAEIEAAIATLIYMAATLDELDSRGVEF